MYCAARGSFLTFSIPLNWVNWLFAYDRVGCGWADEDHDASRASISLHLCSALLSDERIFLYRENGSAPSGQTSPVPPWKGVALESSYMNTMASRSESDGSLLRKISMSALGSDPS